MYHFITYYEDGGFTEYDNINKAEYTVSGMEVSVSNDEISTHKFPLGVAIYLFSDDATYSVSGKKISCIEVTKE